MEKVCPWCKETFETKSAGKRFCCRKHKDLFHNKARRDKQIANGKNWLNTDQKPLLYLDCAECGKPFHQHRTNQIYCSEDCAYDANAKKARERYHKVG